MLDAMEIARERLGKLQGRYQLAHGMFIADEDTARFAEHDLTVEFSPVLWFPNLLNNVVFAMVSPERAARYFPMRSVADAGARVVIASDGPLYLQTPVASFETAVTRRPPEGGPKNPSIGEAITLKEAIASRTINAAYLAFAEDELGSIETGKLADFIVLDRDLFAIPIDEISEAQVLKTVVKGEVVYEAE
ncbi:MAG: amidohydrolase family protein [Geminicoccaceae bacterium]